MKMSERDKNIELNADAIELLDRLLAMPVVETNPCDGSCQGFCDEHGEPEENLYTQAQMDAALTEVWAKVESLVNDLEFGDLVTKGILMKRLWEAQGKVMPGVKSCL